MYEGHDQAIYDLLAEQGLLAPGPLQAAWDQHRLAKQPLAQLLLEQGLLGRAAFLRAVAQYAGYDYVPELPATLPGDAIAVIPAGLARFQGVAPLTASRTSVTLAV